MSSGPPIAGVVLAVSVGYLLTAVIVAAVLAVIAWRQR